MLLVINEWIFHHLQGSCGENRRTEAIDFLRTFRESDDRMCVPDKQRWRQRAYQLMKRRDIRTVIASKVFHSLLRDTEKTIWQHTTPAISEELRSKLPSEDVYLVEAYLSVGADKLITTDRGLFDSVADSELVSCQMRDDFLSNYLS